MPSFTGPYAVEFTRLWQESLSDLEREIIVDEQITAAEHEELLDWYRGCMADQGLRVTIEADGSVDFGTDDGGRISAAEGVCLTDTMGMREHLQVNPQNLDFRVIIPECLVRHGLVEVGFGPDEYLQAITEYPDWWHDLVQTDVFWACNDDPLELLGPDSPHRP